MVLKSIDIQINSVDSYKKIDIWITKKYWIHVKNKLRQ